MNLMPQFGLFELVTVAIIALIVVGPKDLPRLMRSAGKMMAQARKLGAEFMGAFNQMAREAEMEDMRKEIDALKNDNVFSDAKRSIDDAMRPLEDVVRDEAAELRDASTKPVAQAETEPTDDANPTDTKKAGAE